MNHYLCCATLITSLISTISMARKLVLERPLRSGGFVACQYLIQFKSGLFGLMPVSRQISGNGGCFQTIRRELQVHVSVAQTLLMWLPGQVILGRLNAT